MRGQQDHGQYLVTPPVVSITACKCILQQLRLSVLGGVFIWLCQILGGVSREEESEKRLLDLENQRTTPAQTRTWAVLCCQ